MCAGGALFFFVMHGREKTRTNGLACAVLKQRAFCFLVAQGSRHQDIPGRSWDGTVCHAGLCPVKGKFNGCKRRARGLCVAGLEGDDVCFETNPNAVQSTKRADAQRSLPADKNSVVDTSTCAEANSQQVHPKKSLTHSALVSQQLPHLTGTFTLARSQKLCMNLLKAGLATFSCSSSSWSESDPSMLSSSWPPPPPPPLSSPELLVLLSSIGSRAFAATSVALSEVMAADCLQVLTQSSTPPRTTHVKQRRGGMECPRAARRNQVIRRVLHAFAKILGQSAVLCLSRKGDGEASGHADIRGYRENQRHCLHPKAVCRNSPS